VYAYVYVYVYEYVCLLGGTSAGPPASQPAGQRASQPVASQLAASSQPEIQNLSAGQILGETSKIFGQNCAGEAFAGGRYISQPASQPASWPPSQ